MTTDTFLSWYHRDIRSQLFVLAKDFCILLVSALNSGWPPSWKSREFDSSQRSQVVESWKMCFAQCATAIAMVTVLLVDLQCRK